MLFDILSIGIHVEAISGPEITGAHPPGIGKAVDQLEDAVRPMAVVDPDYSRYKSPGLKRQPSL